MKKCLLIMILFIIAGMNVLAEENVTEKVKEIGTKSNTGLPFNELWTAVDSIYLDLMNLSSDFDSLDYNITGLQDQIDENKNNISSLNNYVVDSFFDVYVEIDLLNDSINNETLERIAGDNVLAQSILAIGPHTIDTDTQLSEQEVDAYVSNNDYANNADILNLQNALNSEESSRLLVYAKLQIDLDQEVADRIAADDNLQSQVDSFFDITFLMNNSINLLLNDVQLVWSAISVLQSDVALLLSDYMTQPKHDADIALLEARVQHLESVIAGLKLVEVCDGLDNDLNGIIDDDIDGQACDTGLLGVCGTGFTSCVEGELLCEQSTYPQAEICSGLTQIDEDCDGLANLDDPDCDGEVEICADLIDNDNDGSIDEEPCTYLFEGACVNNTNDLEIVETLDFNTLSLACLNSCFFGDPLSCQECVETEAGLTSECSECYSDFVFCGAETCLAVCTTNPNGPECNTCIETECVPQFISCSGVTNMIEPNCNDNNPCTDDIYQAGLCINNPAVGNVCDDGNSCTLQDACSAEGVCSGIFEEGCVDLSCVDNGDCAQGEYCQKAEGECGGVGTCEVTPSACPESDSPVCGCDEVTYPNPCFAAETGVNILFAGECEVQCVPDCASRTCGNDGCGGSCGDCAVGDVCDSGGACVTDQVICEPGYASLSGLCVLCEPGFYSPDGTQCFECPIGTTTLGIGSTSVNECVEIFSPTEACVNSNDLSLLETLDYGATSLACSTPCISGDSASCQECVASETGLTSSCSTCFSDLLTCSYNACFSECLGGLDSAECTSCIETECAPAFADCSGIATEPEPDCNDYNSCTDDIYEVGVGCENVPDHTSCDDGNPYTLDTCNVAIGCVSEEITCIPEPEVCDGIDNNCDGFIDEGDVCILPSNSCCLAHGTPGCDNQIIQDVVCAIDAYCCQSAWDSVCVQEVVNEGFCVGVPSIIGEPCDDGDACTVDEVITGTFECVGELLVCDDGDPGTADSCDVSTGCVNAII